MTLRNLCSLLVVASAPILLSSCDDHSTDIVDPRTLDRTQTALVAVDQGSDGELVRYSEQSGIVSASDYATANAGEKTKPVDAIFEKYDRVYLHHRATGEITVVSLSTRKKDTVIAGFPSGNDGALSGMAFSNLAQAWVICYGSPNLYQVDTKFRTIADTIPLPGNPTCVGTSGTLVFVGLEQPDGTGTVVMLRSNSGGNFAIEKTLSFPTPIIYIAQSIDSTRAYFVSAGNRGADPSTPDDDVRPMLYAVGTGSRDVIYNYELTVPALTDLIGKEPTYAGISHNDNIFLTTPGSVLLISTTSQGYIDWFTGAFSAVGVDFNSELVYAATADGSVIKRKASDGAELPDVSLPSRIHAIAFVSTSKVQ